jgi:hypothetical protein
MSGILNPIGASSDANSSAPHRDETRSGATASSLPFGIGSAGLRSGSGDATSQSAAAALGADHLPANESGANALDHGPGQTANSSVDAQARYEFESARRNAQKMLNSGNIVDALRELSRWYGHPVVQPEEQSALVELLGQLAGSVIYSRQHWLLPAYVVRSGDTLESIAAQYDLPWQLLAKINGIKNSSDLAAGQELKVIRGPFQGQLDLQQQWLTVFVDRMYAGRFRVETRGPINKPEGWYPVVKFTANSSGAASEGPRHISLGGDVQLLCPDEAGPGGVPGTWLGALHGLTWTMCSIFSNARRSRSGGSGKVKCKVKMQNVEWGNSHFFLSTMMLTGAC